jgi:hypothetical protein
MSSWPSWYGILRSPRRTTFAAVKKSGREWCGDNDAFHGLYCDDAFGLFLEKGLPYQGSCRFIACPDVVCDAPATSELWGQKAEMIHERGYLAAFVLQDGHTQKDIPLNADAIFIGGSTDHKFSKAMRHAIVAAQERNLWVHIGRVNSQRRIAYFQSLGADSCDGTTINRGPDIKQRLLSVQLRQRSIF